MWHFGLLLNSVRVYMHSYLCEFQISADKRRSITTLNYILVYNLQIEPKDELY